jgi:hypothetical protein
MKRKTPDTLKITGGEFNNTSDDDDDDSEFDEEQDMCEGNEEIKERTERVNDSNNNEIWKIKYLESNPMDPTLFYIIKFAEEEVLFPQATLNKLVGKSFNRYLY